MGKIIVYMTVAIMAGCGYKEPALDQPYGILHPVGNLKIVEIDDENVVTFSGDYVVRAVPGPHILTLNYGSNHNTPVEGSKSYLGELTVDVKEGTRYYLVAEYYYDSANVLIGDLKVLRSWKPVLKKEEPIEGYSTPPASAGVARDTSNRATDQ